MATVSIAPGVCLREAAFDDFEQIARLERGHDVGRKTFQRWQRLWTENPAFRRRPGWPIGWVLEHGERIVGSLGNIPVDYELDGRPIAAAAGRSWVTEPEYRAYAALLMDEFFQQQGVDLFLSTTVNHKALDAFGAFEVQRVPSGHWDRSAFWITNYRGFARAMARSRGWRIPAWAIAPGLFAKELACGRRLAARSDLGVWQELAFDERFDDFWQRLRARRRDKLLAVRSREALEWHYRAALEQRRLWILTVLERGRIAAYSIFWRKDSRLHGLKRMRLVDFQSLGDERKTMPAMLAFALQLCREEGIDVLEDLGCCMEGIAAPNRRKLASWTSYYKTEDAELVERLAQPRAWRLTLFDGDSSL